MTNTQSSHDSGSAPPVKPVSVVVVVFAFSFWLLPGAMILLSYITSPGFIVPFLNHPVARIIILTSAVLHTLWCGLWASSGFFRWHIGVKIILGILVSFSTVYLILLPMLGPALITIFQALGPVAGSPR